MAAAAEVWNDLGLSDLLSDIDVGPGTTGSQLVDRTPGLNTAALGSLPIGTYGKLGSGGGGGLPTNASAYGSAGDDDLVGVDGIAALLDVDENGPQFPPLMATKQRKVSNIDLYGFGGRHV